MSRHRRESLGDDFGYTPGEQPPDHSVWLKLNTNEAPLPPSSAVAEAVAAAAAELQRYPSATTEPLRSAIADRHQLRPDQVICGNGADQILDCCFRAFVEPGEHAATLCPTYSLFPVLAKLFGVQLDEFDIETEHEVPAKFAAAHVPLRFVVNPNSPTGAWITPQRLHEALATAAGVVVIDEAYADFAPASCVSLLAEHDNWLVVRSFSKSHALAGLRVGYALGSAELVADLVAVQDSYPVDRCAAAGALAALNDEAHHTRLVSLVRTQRAHLTMELRDRGWTVPDSQANFVLARPPQADAAAAAAALRERRVLVRTLSTRALADHVRITVGDGTAVDRLLAAIDDAGLCAAR